VVNDQFGVKNSCAPAEVRRSRAGSARRRL
jgi:hypothetical protein